MVSEDALPPKFRERWLAIWADLTKYKPDPEFERTDERPWGQTELTLTLRKIRKKTAANIAERIFQLTSELEYDLEHLSTDDATPGTP